MALAGRVVLDSRPFVRPLLELLDEGEPAGVVVTSAPEAEVLDWRLSALPPPDASRSRAGGGAWTGSDAA
jgi:Bacterial archaeo-eukaryotic release factor family 10